MWDLVLHSPMLWTWVTDIKVTGFRAGLLIRSKLVVPASFTSRFGRNVSATLHEQFQRSIAFNRTTAGSFLNITGIKLVAADIEIIVIVVIIALVLLTVIAVTFHRFWKRGQIHKSNMVCRMLIIEPSKKRNRKFYELRLDSSSPFPSPGPAISPNHFSVPTKVAGSEILRNTSPILS
ncbi:hypothetical protein HPB47_000126 [Ixodes persulcatus]|uniref:Uncharacterized protein n=1 Tax=Ixodes persulcatus TaxID=34615 RepID=A0AC60PUI9_IXOPE|nr:hypothetical protein HPB47_000126 [Ixodes persulcatus]